MMSFDGGGGPHNLDLSKARLSWSIAEDRSYPMPVARLRSAVEAGILHAFRNGSVRSVESDRWGGPIDLGFSLYQDCETTVSLEEASESSGVVRIRFRFGVTERTTFGSLWLVMSGVGLPLAYGWRVYSERTARAFARDACRRFWGAMEALVGPRAYR